MDADTYHLWALVGTANVHDFLADGNTWLSNVWDHYKKAVENSLSKLGSNGLMNVDKTADWQVCVNSLTHFWLGVKADAPS